MFEEAYDYLEEFKENMHRFDLSQIEIATQEYVKECFCIYEGVDVVNRLNAIHEAASDKAGSWWQRFKAFFGKIWQRFLERVEKLRLNDANYLTKYKNIILGKKMKDATYKLPDYGEAIKRINDKNNIILPDIKFVEKLEDQVGADYTQGKGVNVNAEDNQKKWRTDIQNFVTNGKIKASGEQSFADVCKAYYQGGEAIDIPSSRLNITEMYNFCFSKDQLIKNLEAQNKSFNTWMDKAEKAYNNAYKTMTNERAKGRNIDAVSPTNSEVIARAKAEAARTAANSAPNQTSSGAQQESYVYTNVYGMMAVTEAGVTRELSNSGSARTSTANNSNINKPSNVANNAGSYAGSTRTADQNAAAKASGSSANAANNDRAAAARQGVGAQATATANKNYDTAKAAGDAQAAAKEWTGLVTSYTKIVTETCSTVMGAIYTAAEKIGKDYMAIIRMHVNDYLGDVNSSDDNAGAASAGNAQTDMSGQQNVTNNIPGL